MNILITGANGFIGNHILKFLENEHLIYSLVNGETYNYTGNNIVVNLLNHKHTESLLLENLELDIIIHTASKLASSSNLNDISLLTENILMYQNLTSIINRFQPTKVINFSSIAVYPNKDGEYFEDSEIRPSINNDGLYGLSKFCGENILDMTCKKTLLTHLRVAQVYGDGMREDRIFEIMKKELKETNIITVFGKGRRISGFIDINTLLDKVTFFINNTFTGIYNVSAENLSYTDLALRIINQYGDAKSIIKLVNHGLSSQCLINTDKLKKIEVKDEL